MSLFLGGCTANFKKWLIRDALEQYCSRFGFFNMENIGVNNKNKSHVKLADYLSVQEHTQSETTFSNTKNNMSDKDVFFLKFIVTNQGKTPPRLVYQ